MNAWQEVVPISEVPKDDLWVLLAAMVEYMNVEIVREETPDYTSYEIRSKTR